MIAALDKKPVVMGHSTGGLLTYMIAGRGIAAASVPIDPGPFRGVLPLPFSALKSACAGAAQSAQPRQGDHPDPGAVQLRLGQRAQTRTRRRALYETYHVAAPGVALMQMANANLNPFTEAKADSKNPERGPMLIISGEKDHTVPWAIANAAYKRQKRNPAVTEIVEMPNRGHSLTIDSGWQEVAQTALDFLKKNDV